MKQLIFATYLFFLTLAITIVILLSPVYAQQILCRPTGEILAGLINKYHEMPLFDGEIVGPAGQAPAHLYANPQTGTWSLVVENKDTACILIAGKDFKPAGPIQPEPGPVL